MHTERLTWIGEDPGSQKLFELIQRVALISTPVLIRGESGTGKNYLARLIHELGPRRDNPFLKIDCMALPNDLVKAELFGYERGGFAGAAERKIGAFELACKGTVALDGIEALDATVQQKLLRILQEQKLERLGGKEIVVVEARLILLTEANLDVDVMAGRFREDLNHRLEKMRIRLAPLREKPTDILPLAEHLLEAIAKKHQRAKVRLGDSARTMLQAYRWPGNVRELQSALETAVLAGQSCKAGESTTEAADFPAELQAAGQQNGTGHLRGLEEVEREAIVATLEATDYRIGVSSKILGISRKTLLEKRKKFGLR